MWKLIHWKRPTCCERLKAGGEEGDREGDGGMASLTQWTGVWANSGRQWRTGKPGVLQSMGLQRVGHDWATKLQQQREGEPQFQLAHCFQSFIYPSVFLYVWNEQRSVKNYTALITLKSIGFTRKNEIVSSLEFKTSLLQVEMQPIHFWRSLYCHL